ncbi:MAG: radical SAM protein [Oscillospiraceae bacterium]|nr:radical SAM protein [Oscillospiraceae bacterium]
MTTVYPIGGSLYVNVTNRCTNNCDFCIRNTPSGVGDVDLWLDREPSGEEIYNAIIGADPQKYGELVFCGYGEPFFRADEIIYTARKIKAEYDIPVRVNTNGHANRINGRDITQELTGIIDVLSISLNAENAEKYNKICKCAYGEEGFYEMLGFARKAKKYVPRVILSVVDIIGEEEIEKCRRVCEKAGCEFRVREYSE